MSNPEYVTTAVFSDHGHVEHIERRFLTEEAARQAADIAVDACKNVEGAYVTKFWWSRNRRKHCRVYEATPWALR